MSKTKTRAAVATAWALWAMILFMGVWVSPDYPPKAHAEDDAGAYTKLNAVAEGYRANAECWVRIATSSLFTPFQLDERVLGLRWRYTAHSGAIET